MSGTEIRERKKPGPPPGTHHAGTFKPGYDPRRWNGGQPRSRELEAMVKGGAPQAINFLLQLCENEEAPYVERRKAAEYVANQAMGSPVNRALIASTTEAQGGAMGQLMALLEQDHPHPEAEVEAPVAVQDESLKLSSPEQVGTEEQTTPHQGPIDGEVVAEGEVIYSDGVENQDDGTQSARADMSDSPNGGENDG